MHNKDHYDGSITNDPMAGRRMNSYQRWAKHLIDCERCRNGQKQYDQDVKTAEPFETWFNLEVPRTD